MIIREWLLRGNGIRLWAGAGAALAPLEGHERKFWKLLAGWASTAGWSPLTGSSGPSMRGLCCFWLVAFMQALKASLYFQTPMTLTGGCRIEGWRY